MAVVAGILQAVGGISAIERQRRTVQEMAYCDAAKPNDCTSKAASAAIRAAVANEASVDIALWQLELGAVGLIGVGFTVFYARLAWREAERSAEAATKAYLSEHRPKLRVRNINVKRIGDSPVNGTLTLINPGEIVAGQLYVSNVGGSDAAITDALVIFYGTDRPHPMERPYEGRSGNATAVSQVIGPGQSTPVLFQVPAESALREMVQPFNQTAINPHAGSLYAMGWVEYVGGDGRQYRTAFCRHYHQGLLPFIRITDSDMLDYEHEE